MGFLEKIVKAAGQQLKKMSEEMQKEMEKVEREAEYLHYDPRSMVRCYQRASGKRKYCWAKILKNNGINPNDFEV